jgi:hypothetical protein
MLPTGQLLGKNGIKLCEHDFSSDHLLRIFMDNYSTFKFYEFNALTKSSTLQIFKPKIIQIEWDGLYYENIEYDYT